MSETLAIAGAGGHRRVVADTAEALGWTASPLDDNGAGKLSVLDTAAWLMHGSGRPNGIVIARDAIIGVVASIVSDVPDATTVVGTPASRLIRS
jgi:acetyltransferase-like isoleucine patch superfamily enzyme